MSGENKRGEIGKEKWGEKKERKKERISERIPIKEGRIELLDDVMDESEP